ncbi:hypothetical protein HCC61_17350 [Streptomyces sp. HNM0575]|uniref:hypothetical protein n=1 Tax=Streptomyces sp. HNM0575 TaxID=2716338 RepID=UPI00145DC849|nr:hypothetical protein [Streptomyces sp. HNM0575]NLU74426.1 hypothetical protein [Streptomyces sp. HNM0575]
MTATVVTIALAFVGYLATYFNGVRLTQRQERLSRVNRQLSDFYGPLFALTETNNRVFKAFMEHTATRPDGRSPFAAGGEPPTDEELAEWRLWVTTVFLPTIRAMRDIVVTKADLLAEQQVPAVLLELSAHVSGYEIMEAQWARGDNTRHYSDVWFPAEELSLYARQAFAQLKEEQSSLLGRRRKQGNP